MTEPKLVVITGASSGIGAATARLLSSKNYPLLLLARRVENCEKLNLPDTMCRKAVADAEEKYGPVACLVNNAGTMKLASETEKQDVSEWDLMIDVNLKGVLNGVKVVLPGMKQRKTGTIINVSSIAGRKEFPNHVVYCGTKYGVHGMSEVLRGECAPYNVRVSIVAPGAVTTELLGQTTDASVIEGYKEWVKTAGSLQADDVASSVEFILSRPQRVTIREIVLSSANQVE